MHVFFRNSPRAVWLWLNLLNSFSTFKSLYLLTGGSLEVLQ
uniref:Uncharacterized protein n=1 Tax=Arundo donax TaxID=35708 RepID=A0A0A8XSB6_ARUDO